MNLNQRSKSVKARIIRQKDEAHRLLPPLLHFDISTSPTSTSSQQTIPQAFWTLFDDQADRNGYGSFLRGRFALPFLRSWGEDEKGEKNRGIGSGRSRNAREGSWHDLECEMGWDYISEIGSIIRGIDSRNACKNVPFSRCLLEFYHNSIRSF